MRLFFATSLLLTTTIAFAENKLQPRCVELESHTEYVGTELMFQGSAVSSDRQFYADYAYIESESTAYFRLWSTVTGRLLQHNKIGNYVERSGQTRFHFSPKNGFVYLEGMSSDTSKDSATSQFYSSYGDIPFWNLKTNQLVLSPCGTGMGVSEVQFSYDEKVAYSRTVDSHYSLCSTHEKKLFANQSSGTSDPQLNKLFKEFASKDYVFFHELKKHLDLSKLEKGVFIYQPTSAEIQALPTINNDIEIQRHDTPKYLGPAHPVAESSEFYLSGGYASDAQYDQLEGVLKFDQFLVFTSKLHAWADKTNSIFVLNWKTGRGQVVNFAPAMLGYMRPHWVPKLQKLYLELQLDETASLNVYDVKTNKLERIIVHDNIYHSKSVVNSGGEPELHYMAYQKEEKSVRYCRL